MCMETSPARCSHTSDAGLYVLGELKGYDLDAFARHLQTCDECADEVELLEEAGDAVPLLAARHVPLDRPEQTNRLFLDHAVFALSVHFAQTYGGMRLAPFTLRTCRARSPRRPAPFPKPLPTGT